MQSKIQEIIVGKSGEAYNKTLENIDDYTSPHEFIKTAYSRYNSDSVNNNLNGLIFEYLVCETLAQQNIMPFYFQATFAHVPNCSFDIVLYHPIWPVVLSLKTSLRERYKQADLEGIALRQVYRKAKQYLITLDAKEADSNRPKIESGDIAGLDDIIVGHRQEYTDLLKELHKNTYQEATEIMPLSGKKIQK